VIASLLELLLQRGIGGAAGLVTLTVNGDRLLERFEEQRLGWPA
jgi:hypothetical protein